MTELKALGLVNMQKADVVCSDGIIRNSLIITLKEQFNWFLTDEFKTLREGFKPESESDSESGSDYGDDDDDDSSGNGNVPGQSNVNNNDQNIRLGQDQHKGGRPKTDWNNVLENNPVKEKSPTYC
jgi:hypothetical protein